MPLPFLAYRHDPHSWYFVKGQVAIGVRVAGRCLSEQGVQRGFQRVCLVRDY